MELLWIVFKQLLHVSSNLFCINPYLLMGLFHIFVATQTVFIFYLF